jgi:hypothetical protein
MPLWQTWLMILLWDKQQQHTYVDDFPKRMQFAKDHLWVGQLQSLEIDGSYKQLYSWVHCELCNAIFTICWSKYQNLRQLKVGLLIHITVTHQWKRNPSVRKSEAMMLCSLSDIYWPTYQDDLQQPCGCWGWSLTVQQQWAIRQVLGISPVSTGAQGLFKRGKNTHHMLTSTG